LLPIPQPPEKVTGAWPAPALRLPKPKVEYCFSTDALSQDGQVGALVARTDTSASKRRPQLVQRYS
jgi:hypothetical protein